MHFVNVQEIFLNSTNKSLENASLAKTVIQIGIPLIFESNLINSEKRTIHFCPMIMRTNPRNIAKRKYT